MRDAEWLANVGAGGRVSNANAFFADFERLLIGNALRAILAEHGPLPRGRAQISTAQLLTGLVYHVSQPQGPLATHLHERTGHKISDSAASQRRLTMPWEVFEAILAQALAALADPKRQPEAFYGGLRWASMAPVLVRQHPAGGARDPRWVRRPNGAWREVRLWSSLLDAKPIPPRGC